MKTSTLTPKKAKTEIDELRSRLAEAEDTLRAIRSGEVDALVVSTQGGDQVFTLQGADQAYRVILESMNEGAVTLDASGTVVFSNPRFGSLLDLPIQKVIGATFEKFVAEADRPEFQRVFQEGLHANQREEVELCTADGALISSVLSFSPLALQSPATCVIVTDITQRKQDEEELQVRSGELATLYQAEQRSRVFAETLRRAGLVLTQSLKMDNVLQGLLELLFKVVPYDRAVIYLARDNQDYAVHMGRGFTDAADIDREYITRQECFSKLFARLSSSADSILIADTDQDPDWCYQAELPEVRSWIVIPLDAGEKNIGFCSLEKSTANSLTLEHLRWADALAGQAVVAMQNAWLFEKVTSAQARLSQLSHRLVEVQENERRFVAQELHDDAGQILTSLILELALVRKDASDPAAVLAHAASIENTAKGVLENLRRLAINLRPASLDHVGLVAALEQYIRVTSASVDLNLQFHSVGLDGHLPSEIEITLYRVVQEAVTNIIRHAEATHADILLEKKAGEVLLLVEDDGIGFDPQVKPAPDHLGLLGMQERAEMIGGRLAIESSPGSGVTIQLVVPLDPTVGPLQDPA